MVTRVLDTNVVAKWFLAQEGSERAQTYLEELIQNAARIVVPSSLFYELANVFWLHRHHGVTEARAAGLWAEFASLPLEVIPWTELLPQAMRFGFQHDVSPYDGVFVLLARELDCDLVTADQALWRRVGASCPWVRLL